jgi:hypothetical protein
MSERREDINHATHADSTLFVEWTGEWSVVEEADSQ